MKTRAIPALISALFVLSLASCAIDFDPGEWIESEDLSSVSESSSSKTSEEISGNLKFFLDESGESYTVASGFIGTRTDVDIPSVYKDLPVTSIKKEGFKNTKIATLRLPDSIIEIGESAFESCHDLREVSLGSGVVSIGDNAFFGCSKIEEITIPDSTIVIGNNAFKSSQAKFLSIGRNLKYIGDYAFYRCDGLKNALNLPEGLTYIGDHAFDTLRALVAYIPASVTHIGVGAFSNSLAPYRPSLEYISVDDANENYCSIDGVLYNKAQSEVVTFPTGKNPAYVRDGVSFIGDYAYYNCDHLPESFTIPESVLKIGLEAFGHNNGIKNLTLGKNVTTIGQSAFSQCSLEEVTLNEKLTYIPPYCFDMCLNLKSVTLPNAMKTIGEYAFKSNSYLESVTINRNLESIEAYAFSGCYSLTEITYLGTMDEWANIEKGEGWIPSRQLEAVHCINGDLTGNYAI